MKCKKINNNFVLLRETVTLKEHLVLLGNLYTADSNTLLIPVRQIT